MLFLALEDEAANKLAALLKGNIGIILHL